MSLTNKSALALAVCVYAVSLGANDSFCNTPSELPTDPPVGLPSDRIIEWSTGDLNAIARPLIVTSSNPPTGGDRIADPNNLTTSSGIDLSGVGRLFLDTNPTVGSGALCSSSALEGGRFVLTAAHCVADSSGNSAIIDGVDGNSVTFQTSIGTVSVGFTSADVSIHPLYSGDVLDGYDVAVIDLGITLPANVATYGLNDGSTNEADVHLAAGFGLSGDGDTGSLLPAGDLRSGSNNFLTTGLPIGGITNVDTQLTADFDDGTAGTDAFGFFDNAIFGGVVPDAFNGGLGFGADEVGIAPGDSGGPSLIVGTNGPVITGVHSYGLRLELTNGTSSDVDSTLNSTYGEFYVDARVAEPSVLSFIQSVAIPEPSAAWLAASIGLTTAGTRRRQ